MRQEMVWLISLCRYLNTHDERAGRARYSSAAAGEDVIYINPRDMDVDQCSRCQGARAIVSIGRAAPGRAGPVQFS